MGGGATDVMRANRGMVLKRVGVEMRLRQDENPDYRDCHDQPGGACPSDTRYEANQSASLAGLLRDETTHGCKRPHHSDQVIG